MAGLRVDIQIPSLALGGAESMCVELANGLAERDCQVRVFAGVGSPTDMGSALAPNVDREVIGNKSYSLTAATGAARAHRPEYCDVVIYHLTPTLLTLAVQRIRDSRVPAIYVEHGPRLDRRFPLRDLPVSLLYRAATAVVCVTESVRDAYVARIAPRMLSRTLVIPNGVSVDRLATAVRTVNRDAARSALGLPPGVPMAGIIGRLVPVKGHSVFFAEWSALRRASPGARWPNLAVVGDGPLRAQLESEIRQLGLSDVVHFVGSVRPVSHALAAIDLLVLPSLSEGQPMVLLEAMAACLPIAAIGVGGVAALLGDVPTVVPEGAHDVLASEVMRILHLSHVEREQLGARAQDRVRARFDAAHMVDSYLQLCRTLHDGHPLS